MSARFFGGGILKFVPKPMEELDPFCLLHEEICQKILPSSLKSILVYKFCCNKHFERFLYIEIYQTLEILPVKEITIFFKKHDCSGRRPCFVDFRIILRGLLSLLRQSYQIFEKSRQIVSKKSCFGRYMNLQIHLGPL